MDESTLPSRLRSGMFRRFETVIETAVKTGQPVTIVMPALSPHTIIARCRDSISSLRRFKWATAWKWTDADLAALEVYLLDDKTPTIGQRRMTSATCATPSPNSNPNIPNKTHSLNRDLLTALCTLITAEVVAGPVVFRLTDSDFESYKEQLLALYNVAFYEESPGLWVVI